MNKKLIILVQRPGYSGLQMSTPWLLKAGFLRRQAISIHGIDYVG